MRTPRRPNPSSVGALASALVLTAAVPLSAHAQEQPADASAQAWSTAAQASLRARAERERAALRRCRSLGGEHSSTLRNEDAPTLVLALDVARSGRIASARVERSSHPSPVLERCVARVVRRWRLPRHDDPAPRAERFELRLDGVITAVRGEPRLIRALTGPALDALLSGTSNLDGGTGAGHPTGTGVAPPPTGTISLQPPEVTGALAREVVEGAVRGRAGVLRFCYERARSRSPRLQGEVRVDFTISATGTVVRARIGRTSLHSADTESCVLAQLYRVRFPAPERGEVTVSYPMTFSPAPASASTPPR